MPLLEWGVFGFFCGIFRAIIIPNTEPLEFYSGETVFLKRADLFDYPSLSPWKIYYIFQKSGTRIKFN